MDAAVQRKEQSIDQMEFGFTTIQLHGTTPERSENVNADALSRLTTCQPAQCAKGGRSVTGEPEDDL